MKKVCLIQGSLRGSKSSSLSFLDEVDRLLPDGEIEKTFITVRARAHGSYPEAALNALSNADAIIIAFPLFVYSLPGGLTRLLEDYCLHVKSTGTMHRASRVYAIVNCGFVMPEINGDAIRVLQNFCRRLELNWRFAISIGCGPLAVMRKKVPLMNMKIKRGFADIAADIRWDGTGEKKTVLIRPLVPRSVLIFLRDSYERLCMIRHDRQVGARGADG